MAVDAGKSQSITNLDATPYVYNSAGQGAPTRVMQVDDIMAITTNGLASVGSTYRVIRFPTGAIPKSLTIYTDAPLDSHSTPGLVMDFNIAFSDSTIDGTQSNPAGSDPAQLQHGRHDQHLVVLQSEPDLRAVHAGHDRQRRYHRHAVQRQPHQLHRA